MSKVRLVLALIIFPILLAACGGDDSDKNTSDGSNTTSEAPTDVAAIATEEVIGSTVEPPEFAGQVMVAGVRTTDDLEVLSSRTYVNPEGTAGWIVMEVVNPTEEIAPNIATLVSLLDSNSRERDTLRFSSPFLNIPPNVPIPMFLVFPPPTDYKDYVAVVQVEDYNASNPFIDLQGIYDLPYTVSDIPSGEFPLQLTGTITNNSGQTLTSPAAVVAAYDGNGQILGATLPTMTGLSDAGEWLDGTDLTLEITFLYLPESPSEVRVMGAGYFLE